MGSIITLHKWQIKELYEGMKKLGVAVVWSLKQGKIPQEEDDDFYVREWIPQIEVLSYEGVKAVVSHCGQGGVYDSIYMCKPILCIAYYGDEVVNS